METTEIVKVAVLEEQMKVLGKGLETLGVDLGKKLDSLTDKIDNNYVKKEDSNKFYRDEFVPVKQTVEGLKLWQAKMVGIAIASAVIVDYVFRFLTKN